jgi:hypothetical protein
MTYGRPQGLEPGGEAFGGRLRSVRPAAVCAVSAEALSIQVAPTHAAHMNAAPMNAAPMSDEQRVQDEQGWTVFERIEGTDLSAPATAHVNAISTKDGSGPYPWRQPV